MLRQQANSAPSDRVRGCVFFLWLGFCCEAALRRMPEDGMRMQSGEMT
jgi:hypothetical protein